MSEVLTVRPFCRLVSLAAVLAALFLGSVAPLRPVPANALAVLHLDPTTSTAGSALSVTGTGFAKLGLVAVWADFRMQSGVRRSTMTVHSSATGAINARLQIPAGTQPGAYAVTATDFHGHRASASLRVVAGVTLRVGTVTPITPAAAGTSVRVAGAGFAPGAVTLQSSFSMYLGKPVSVTRTVQAGAGGSFPAVVVVVPYGARSGVMKATDSIGQTVIADIVVQYRPIVSVHPSPIPTRAAFQVNGTGYIPGSRVTFTFTRLGTNRRAYVGQTTAGKGGRIQIWVHPGGSLLAGTYALAATGTGGTPVARATVMVTSGPTISAEPPAVVPGSREVIHGFHFPPVARVRVAVTVPIRNGPPRTLIARSTSGRSGEFRAAFHVPAGASSGIAHVNAESGTIEARSTVQVLPPPQRITAEPSPLAPGETLSVAGAGFPAGDTVSIGLAVTLGNGTTTDLNTTALAGRSGTFSVSIDLPSDAAPGSYRVTAQSGKTHKRSGTSITVAPISPSILALPLAAAPGTSITVTGFGFPAGAPVQLSLPGGSGTATADSSGRFFSSLSVPASTGPGKLEVTAQSGATSATSSITVSGTQIMHAYFPSLYTGVGYHEYIALLNPTETDAQATISYLLAGTTRITVSLPVPAHSRVTRDVNADLGTHASAAAVVTATGPVVAERLMRHHDDVAVDSGATATARTWYFAWGNTSHGYREYLSVENPNKRAANVAFVFMPAHGRQFTLFKTVDSFSRLTINVGAYVPDDAVAVKITSPRSIVAGRTVFIDNGVSSKTGATAANKTWYFAAGPRQAFAVNWLALLNPGHASATVTIRAYGAHGGLLASVRRDVGAFAQQALPIGKLAQHTDVAVAVTSTAPIVAEQTTYVGSKHDDTTDAFGMTAPARSRIFAVMGTRSAQSEADQIDIFNPSSAPAAVVLQLIPAKGVTSQQSLVVAPHARETVNVGQLMKNVQLGAVLESSLPVVVMNRYSTDRGVAGDTSTGIPGSTG